MKKANGAKEKQEPLTEEKWKTSRNARIELEIRKFASEDTGT